LSYSPAVALAERSASPAFAADPLLGAVPPRAVIEGAFSLLTALREMGTARVSGLQRECGLPRTTVHRLLGQLAEVGAVERSGRLWRLGPALVALGAEVPAEPRLRAVARRPLLDLANATGALVSLSVEMAGRGVVIDVLPGRRRLPLEPDPGMTVSDGRLASAHACARAHRGDMRPAVDAGAVHPGISCVAAPFRLSPRDVGAVGLMVPGGVGVSDLALAATRRTAGRIASALSRPPLTPLSRTIHRDRSDMLQGADG
jgi:DNA-binding IclR family transcriptional regulator